MNRDPLDSIEGVDPSALASAVYQNSFRSVRNSVASLGLRTHAVRYEATSEALAGRVAEEFLINSRLKRGDVEFILSLADYFSDSGEVISLLLDREKAGTEEVLLPESVRLRMSLAECILRRRSARIYTGDRISFPYLATILRMACGVTGHLHTARQNLALPVRGTPSAGGLYPVQLFVAVQRVQDLGEGVYAYDPRGNKLWATGDSLDVISVAESVATPSDVITVSEAAVIFLLIGRPWRSMRKYGPRGMRHIFLEAGAMAEHINLTSVALGLGSVDCSGIYDDELHEALGIDGLYQALLHCVLVGVPV